MSASALTFSLILQLQDLASNKLGAFTKKMAKLGGITAAAGLAMRPASNAARGFIENVARQAIALDEAAAKIRSMPGITDSAVNDMVAAGRRWAIEHTESADRFVDTSYMMLSAGLNAQQALVATQTGLRVAKATMGDAGETANLLATIYNNFADKTANVNTEMGLLGDVLTRTQQQFQFKNMGQLAEGLNYATPAALAARMEIIQLNAVVGQLNNSGLQGGMAGTAFAASIRQMTKASQDLGFAQASNADGGLDFIGTLENIREKYGDLTKLSDKNKLSFQKAFGDEGLRAVILLSRNLEGLRKNQEAVRDSANAAAEGQAKMESGAGARMQIAMNNWNEFRLIMGEQLIPVLKDIIPRLSRLVQSVSAFAQAHPGVAKTLIAMAGFGAIVAPVLSAAGSVMVLIGGLSTLGPVMGWIMGIAGRLILPIKALTLVITYLGYGLRALVLSNPIVAFLVALGTAAYLVYKNWDTLKKWFGQFWEWIKVKAVDVGKILMKVMLPLRAAKWLVDQAIKITAPAASRPRAPSVSGAGQQRVGGTVHVKIDSEGRARVHQVRSDNPRVPVQADVGRTMVMP